MTDREISYNNSFQQDPTINPPKQDIIESASSKQGSLMTTEDADRLNAALEATSILLPRVNDEPGFFEYLEGIKPGEIFTGLPLHMEKHLAYLQKDIHTTQTRQVGRFLLLEAVNYFPNIYQGVLGCSPFQSVEESGFAIPKDLSDEQIELINSGPGWVTDPVEIEDFSEEEFAKSKNNWYLQFLRDLTEPNQSPDYQGIQSREDIIKPPVRRLEIMFPRIVMDLKAHMSIYLGKSGLHVDNLEEFKNDQQLTMKLFIAYKLARQLVDKKDSEITAKSDETTDGVVLNYLTR